jgi:hypothetical protein
MSFVGFLLSATVIGILVPLIVLASGGDEVPAGLLTGFLVWIFAAHAIFMNNGYAQRDIKLSLIDSAYNLITFLTIGVIMAIV